MRRRRRDVPARAGAAGAPGGGDPPPAQRIVLPMWPSIDEAETRVQALQLRMAEMYALLEPTAAQGAEAGPQRLEFARWAHELGTALCEADRGIEGIPLLEAAAQIAEVVVGHEPENLRALGTGVTAVASLAHELTLQGRSAEAWEWAARTAEVAREWVVAAPDDPEGPLQASRLAATLASLSVAKQPPPPAFMRDESVPGQELTPVEPFYGWLFAAVDSAQQAVRRDPDHEAARFQLGQEAWNLGVYLETRPGLPAGDVGGYARVVVEALTPFAAQGRHPGLCEPALAWARTHTGQSGP